MHIAALAELREWLLDGVKEKSGDEQPRTERDVSLPRVSSPTQLRWHNAPRKHRGAAPRALKAVQGEVGMAGLS